MKVDEALLPPKTYDILSDGPAGVVSALVARGFPDLDRPDHATAKL